MATTHGGRELAALRARVRQLETVIGEAYQLAGAVGAPERVLDNLSAAIDGGDLPHTTFLPVLAEECGEVASLLSARRKAMAATLGRVGGARRTRAKSAAARANGAKGGRPRKDAR